MNFLAHATLSFNDEGVLVGNMISDFVKGRNQYDYPNSIQKGIRLHRLIDSFTDSHPTNRQAREIFRPSYRLYSGALVDVVYDHFVALNPDLYTENTLFTFSQQSYEALGRHTQWLPLGFAGMFPYMRSQNWLFGYRARAGIAKSLEGVVRRSKYMQESRTAFDLFERNFQLLEDCYRHFWADLYPYALRELRNLEDEIGE